MSEQNHTEWLERIEHFKQLVRANRICCDSDLAREAHDTVVAVLDDLCENIKDIIVFTRAFERETDAGMSEEPAHPMRQREQAVAFLGKRPRNYVLGGYRCIEDDCFVNPVTQRTETMGSDRIIQPIPDERLCGLPAILDTLAAETRMTFDRTIIFWKAPIQAPATPDAIFF